MSTTEQMVFNASGSRKLRRTAEEVATGAIDQNDFAGYQLNIIHSWLQTITALTFVLVPLFFVLDIFIAPRELLPLFGVYRAVSTVLALIQHLVVRNTKPTRHSFLHGYFVTLQVGGIIAIMTVYLGGFESGYYAGLIMVIIGANLLMPWHAAHTAVNAGIVLVLYIGLNLGFGGTPNWLAAANNLFFLAGTSIISVAINHVRYRLIQSEFSLLVQLKQARDALWSEMELAKQVQVALLPRRLQVTGYEVAVVFEPAREVGGDYYDVIEAPCGSRYIAIGDVAGHGLDSGLIMMMAQTAVMTVVKGNPGCSPTEVLTTVNTVLRENVGRLGSNHYMTMTVIKLEDDHLTVAGHHQDLLVYRSRAGIIESIPTQGSWLGIADDVSPYTEAFDLPFGVDDRVLLFSDGLTEATSDSDEMYGQVRLAAKMNGVVTKSPAKALEEIRRDVESFQAVQQDDITMIMVQRKE